MPIRSHIDPSLLATLYGAAKDLPEDTPGKHLMRVTDAAFRAMSKVILDYGYEVPADDYAKEMTGLIWGFIMRANDPDALLSMAEAKGQPGG